MWYDGNSGDTTHAVGLKRPYAWALYDMHGNVSQQCQDWWDKDYYGKSPTDDPSGPGRRLGPCGSRRELECAAICRSAFRDRIEPGSRHGTLGFRACLVLPGKPVITAENPNTPATTENAVADPDRRGAEWVLSLGGTVMISEPGSEREVKAIADIPPAFKVLAVNLWGKAEVNDDGLRNLVGLTDVGGIGINGARVTDRGRDTWEPSLRLTVWTPQIR